MQTFCAAKPFLAHPTRAHNCRLKMSKGARSSMSSIIKIEAPIIPNNITNHKQTEQEQREAGWVWKAISLFEICSNSVKLRNENGRAQDSGYY